ncbi:MAG: ATP-binding protein [Pseudobdellovibrionaceae bacterium]
MNSSFNPDQRLLVVEDSQKDFDALQNALRQEGLNPTFRRVQSSQEFLAALEDPDSQWDLIVSDDETPDMPASQALQKVKELGLPIPFVAISSQMSEEAALSILKAGATDCLLKKNIFEQAHLIAHYLSESREKKLHNETETYFRLNDSLRSQLMESRLHCIKIITFDGKIESISSTAQTLLEVQDMRDVVGYHWTDLWEDPQEHANAEALIESAKKGASGHFVGFSPTLSGTPKWWDVIAMPLLDIRGRPEKIILIARDITKNREVEVALKQSEKRLKIVLERANSANELKTAFLANMSHEIRTPLGAVLGFAEILGDPSVPEFERRKCREAIHRNGELLTHLIDEILDLSRVESGHLETQKARFLVRTLVSEVLMSLQVQADTRKINLQFEMDPQVPEEICTDPLKLKQILINLTHNAIKFTQQGSVSLRLSLGPSGKNSDILAFDVQDSGIGISADQQEGLFKPFSQVDYSLTRKYGGAGLGLALSKKIAQALGGDVTLVKSVPHEGSLFRVTIRNYLSSMH